ncbi:MAG: bifunctional phosphoribosylaminoimidazolecarboxamide formyltransferase/IMP cyclohydrolase [Hyphomonadaceae bacterium]
MSATPFSTSPAPDLQEIKRALISVSDKAGLIEHAKALTKFGISLISTGGTHAALKEGGVPAMDVSLVTGFPEIMDGRVKTLHPKVHGGLLARRNAPEHEKALDDHHIPTIDLLYVNLYPFEETVARGASFEECIENIDVGGPAMIRAAAKNHDFVVVATDAADLTSILDELRQHRGATTLALRRKLAQKAFARCAAYDAAIANWFANTLGEDAPAWRSFSGRLAQPLRYGENPHQKAAFYIERAPRLGVATAEQIQGKELSYINLLDADAAFELVSEFNPAQAPAVAIIKHANPCGVAIGPSLKAAYERALACDPVSRFGGIIAVNGVLDVETAEAISDVFTEVIIAPDVSVQARAFLAKKKNVRVLVTGGLPNPAERGWLARSVSGGLLVQERDNSDAGAIEMKVVTKREPTAQEMADMRFAFRVCKHVKSNAIVYAKNGATVGIGAGQMSRVESARIARRKAEEAAHQARLADPETIGSVCASDAFFPFPDGLEQAAQAGATAVIQPGGAMRDDDVIAAADKAGIAMVFTGVRQFRH